MVPLFVSKVDEKYQSSLQLGSPLAYHVVFTGEVYGKEALPLHWSLNYRRAGGWSPSELEF
jgi:hypothetical protein